jgi:hypothetical protein
MSTAATFVQHAGRAALRANVVGRALGLVLIIP